ncbi:Energy-coupling factor transporter transmembrane protein EcfT [Candidatus Hepatoplasma crinochetorum Av]|uniref:Energy-coupling factor transporter transmembrane protein EcfT n=1 Tax=Candidatus Hepatoplasma crinochetorum Av TaxID=1427984 RepID=W8GEQ4_9MOLU|nr:energy-coupling factor transporter transmembrane protein EcfT [Candidatus Hepatoplasma crinochetorum]AHK22274.1 Energy-coupling factor transporter transmembrane protein EcfT [Candidatus Hepatoplasma crinochetorum Av]
MEITYDILSKKDFNSFIDKINPRAKFIVYFLMIILVLFAPGFIYDQELWFYSEDWYLLGTFFASILFALIVKTPFKTYRNLFYYSIFTFIIFFILNSLFFLDAKKGFILTFEITIRIFILLLISSILILSSTQKEISDAISFFIYPLRYIKVPVNEFSLIITIGLRFLPLIILEAEQILQSLSTRGIDFYSSSFKIKIKAFFALFNPLFISAFDRANNLSYALYVRQYQIGKKRTQYNSYKFNLIDFCFIFFFIVIFVVGLTFIILI